MANNDPIGVRKLVVMHPDGYETLRRYLRANGRQLSTFVRDAIEEKAAREGITINLEVTPGGRRYTKKAQP